MNKTQEALKMAIDFVDEITNAVGKYPYVDKTSLVADAYAMSKKLNEALEQQEQEPVAVCVVMPLRENDARRRFDIVWKNGQPIEGKLYTHPNQWQGLTDDEIEEIIVGKNGTYFNFARAIEQALKEKNHD